MQITVSNESCRFLITKHAKPIAGVHIIYLNLLKCRFIWVSLRIALNAMLFEIKRIDWIFFLRFSVYIIVMIIVSSRQCYLNIWISKQSNDVSVVELMSGRWSNDNLVLCCISWKSSFPVTRPRWLDFRLSLFVLNMLLL